MYQSFQAAVKAITIKHPLLPYIDVRCKGYMLLPSKRVWQEEGWYWIHSPSPFTPKDLGVTVAVPTLVDRPWRKERRKRAMLKPTALHHPKRSQTSPQLSLWKILLPRWHFKEVESPLPRSWLLLACPKVKHLPQLQLLLHLQQLLQLCWQLLLPCPMRLGLGITNHGGCAPSNP